MKPCTRGFNAVVALLSLLVAGACSAKPAGIVMHLSSADSHRAVITAINAVTTSTGPLVVGEVKNASSGPLDGVQVTVDLLDKSGASLGQQAGPTLLGVVPAGAKASFSIPFTGIKTDVGQVSATVQADPNMALERVPLTVSAKTGSIQGANYEVSGTVVNSSQVPVTFANVVATFFDSTGHVVGAAHDVSDGATIAPGGSTTFLIHLLEEARLVSTYTLVAEGQSVTPGH